MDGRFETIVCSVVSAAATIYGAYSILPVPATISAVIFLCTIVIAISPSCSSINSRIIFISVCAVVLVSIASAMFEHIPDSVDRTSWGHLMGAIYWIAVYPAAFLVMEVMVIVAGAKYNFPLLAGLPILIACSLETIAWILASFLCGSQIDSKEFSATEVVTSLFMSLVLSAISAPVVWELTRRSHFIMNDESLGVIR